MQSGEILVYEAFKEQKANEAVMKVCIDCGNMLRPNINEYGDCISYYCYDCRLGWNEPLYQH